MSMGFEDTPRKYKSHVSYEIISMNEAETETDGNHSGNR